MASLPDDSIKVPEDSKNKKGNALYLCSGAVIYSLERFFYWYGKLVSRRPGIAIGFCLVITVLCSLGLFNFRTENRPFKLWIPQESDFIEIFDWQKTHYPQKFRAHMAIFEADNVLDQKVLEEILKVHVAVRNTSKDGVFFHNVCASVPKATDLPLQANTGQLSWLTSVFRQDYCTALENLENECLENNLLEVWGYDPDTIAALTQETIIADVNSTTKSAVFGFDVDPASFLGKIQKDSNGKIISAKATRHIWITEINYTSIEMYGSIDDDGTGMLVDKPGFEWEKEFSSTMLNMSSALKHSKMFFMSSSSFGEVSRVAIEGDAMYLGIGFMIVFIYVQVMLGKFNCVESRPILSFMGIICVYLSVLVSYGICSACGVPFGPVNNVLPFLLLGLGIDDMFVIMQSWNTLTEHEQTKPLSTKMGLALKHAGVSITITSVTDFMAFAIGCTTVLPALRSFCLYAAVGILSVYFFQATFFVAWFSLDQRRLNSKRHGLFWCWKMSNWQPNRCSQRDLCQSFFKNVYSRALTYKSAKVLVLAFTFALLGASCWGFANLRQEFNPIWFLPQSSYLFKFFTQLDVNFPSFGDDGVIFFSNISLQEELSNIDGLVQDLEKSKYIGQVDSWYTNYKRYWEANDVDVLDPDIAADDFRYELGEFLYAPSGSKYRVRNFQFDANMSCRRPSAHVSVSTIDFRHVILQNSRERIAAMDEVKALIANRNFSGSVRAWARIYSGWETDKIIEVELYRNLGMAVTVVFVLSLVLIASVRTSIMVLLCVVFTLIDVMALMHWWDLTIDTVSCIDLVLAVGLCVDYAAHVGHTFMTQRGTRDQRVTLTLTKIGPAVLNGGFSTFLAFVLLATSDSHVFKTFFKVFFGVTLFGLYHGLVFLPVVLSLFGPAAYPDMTQSVAEPQELRQLNVPKSPQQNGVETHKPSLPLEEV